MTPIEVLVECGTTYQPLTIGLHLLQQRYRIERVHILTTRSGYEGARTVMEEFLETMNVITYGTFVDGEGTASDQAEYRANIAMALSYAKHPVVALIASGTNWMTWIFSQMLREHPCYSVRTKKEFKDKCFLPQENVIGTDEEGNVYRYEGSISTLMELQNTPNGARLYLQDKTLHFIGRRAERFSMQEAAMYAYLLSLGGVLDLQTDHTERFNAFCESSEEYATERTLVDEFAQRFRHNVSKINAKLEASHELIRMHLTIERDGERYTLKSPEALL